MTQALPASQVASAFRTGVSGRAEVATAPRFKPGDVVVARNLHPTGHTRLPRYVRGKRGVVERNHGGFVFADTRAHGLGDCPQYLYSVRFAARDLWGDTGSVRDTVYLDLWESYIELPIDHRGLPIDIEKGPGFAAPWHAEAFACAVALSRRGLYTWNEWVDVFSAEVRVHPVRPGETHDDAYHRQWLAALERLVRLKGGISAPELAERVEGWRRAYISTPHGEPVELRPAVAITSAADAAPTAAVGAEHAAHAERAMHAEHAEHVGHVKRARSSVAAPISISPARTSDGSPA